jgi:hypothetical protein
MKTTSHVSLCLAAIGSFLLSLFLVLPNPSRSLHLLGWTGLLFAFVLWLTDSYRGKAALYTRGGLVRYKQNPRLYKSVYLLMLLAGLFAVFVFLVVNFLH